MKTGISGRIYAINDHSTTFKFKKCLFVIYYVYRENEAPLQSVKKIKNMPSSFSHLREENIFKKVENPGSVTAIIAKHFILKKYIREY